MRCAKVQRWISADLDGEADPQQRDRVTRHLHACDRCHEFADGLYALPARLATIDVAEPRWGFEARVMRCVDRDAQEPVESGWRAAWRWLRPAPVGVGAAAFAAGIVLVVLAHAEAPNPGTPQADAVATLASGVLGVAAESTPEDDWASLFSKAED
jgi:anti-sigma factor RsiW